MLSYEREGLSAQSVVPSDAVTDSPMEELTSSSRGAPCDSGFLSRYAVDATAMTISDNNLQLEKEKNEGLRLQLLLEQAKERREMESHRQARDDRQQSEMRELIEQNRRLLAMLSPKKRGRDVTDEDGEA